MMDESTQNKAEKIIDRLLDERGLGDRVLLAHEAALTIALLIERIHALESAAYNREPWLMNAMPKT